MSQTSKSGQDARGGSATPGGLERIASERIREWSDKLGRAGVGRDPAFGTGELVRVSGYLRRDRAGLFISADADGRVADCFEVVGGISVDLLGMPVTAIIEILGVEGERALVDSWRYSARILRVEKSPMVNPSSSELAELPNGARVTLSGEFCGFRKEDDRASGAMLLPEGVERMLSFPDGTIEFSEGALDNLQGQRPEAGDIVSFLAIVKRQAAEITLESEWCDPCVLIIPSKARAQECARLRTEAAKAIEGIVEEVRRHNFVEARKRIANLRQSSLTDAEFLSIECIAKLIPERQRPMIVPLAELKSTRPLNAEVLAIDSSFGVSVESMTSTQLSGFLGEVLAGKRQCKEGGRADLDVLLSLARKLDLPRSLLEEILIRGIKARVERLREQSGKLEDQLADRLFVSQAFKSLVSIGSAVGARFTLDSFLDFVERGEYRPPGWRDLSAFEMEETLAQEPISALASFVEHVPLNILTESLEQLKETASLLEQIADDPYIADKLESVIQYTERTAGSA